MAELNDLIRSFPFRCQKCEAELTSDLLLTAVVTYGVVLLVGEKDGFIGWSCPGCSGLATNFTRLEIESFNQVVHAFRNILINRKIGKLCYHSFPYRYDLKDTDFSGQASRDLTADFEAVHADRLIIYGPELEAEPKFEPPATYCSYQFGSEALGPAISVWWYDDSQVEKLILRETEAGFKLFPRYIVHHPLYSAIDNFCWRSRIHLEEYKIVNIPIDMKAYFRTPGILIKKAFGFLVLLETVNGLDLSLRASPGFPAFILPPTIPSGMIGPVESSPKFISKRHHSNLSEKVWSVFHEERVQQLLDNLADNFISDYRSRIVKIDCRLSWISALAESYQKSLFDAISSRYKRDEIREKTNANLRNNAIEAQKAFPNVKIVSNDKSINEIKILISQMAPLKQADSFLILGDRGSGKDLFAKAIHEASNRKGNFVKVDCGAIPEPLFESEMYGYTKGAFTGAIKDSPGKFGSATDGTIFFDEVGNLLLSLQPKLLRALQDRQYIPVGSNQLKPIDAKFIFATNKNLEKMVEEDSFMPDLYDRFNRPQFTVPPLCERKHDVALLAAHFIQKYDSAEKDNKDLKPIILSKECEDTLKGYDWPGNIRQLEQVIKEIVLKRYINEDRSEISESELPAEITQRNRKTPGPHSKGKKKLPGNMQITDDEIIHWMKEFGNNKTRVAKQLGVTPKTIWLRCKKLGL